MDTEGWLGLVFALLCLAVLVVLWIAEYSLNYLSRGKIKRRAEEGSKKARMLDKLMVESDNLFSTLIVAKSLVLVGFIVSAAVLVIDVHGSGWVVALVSSVAGFTAIGLLRVVSREIAVSRPDSMAVTMAGVLSVVSTTFASLTALLGFLARSATRLLRVKRELSVDDDDIDEMRLLVDVNHEEVDLEEEEKVMIRAVVGLDETITREIMVPRIDIVAANKDSSIREIIECIVQQGYTRIPIYDDTIDNIVGVVYAKDLLPILAQGDIAKPLAEIARPAYFVPESKRVDELLHDFKQSKVHMAVVVDEYGGTAGLVTIEDLLEEIVGEIEDEYDDEEPKVERISENEVIMNAKVSIDEFMEIFSLDIDEEDFDTVGGFVFSRLGRIPSVGDTVQVDSIKIEILSTVGQRVKDVKVTRMVDVQADDSD